MRGEGGEKRGSRGVERLLHKGEKRERKGESESETRCEIRGHRRRGHRMSREQKEQECESERRVKVSVREG